MDSTPLAIGSFASGLVLLSICVVAALDATEVSMSATAMLTAAGLLGHLIASAGRLRADLAYSEGSLRLLSLAGSCFTTGGALAQIAAPVEAELLATRWAAALRTAFFFAGFSAGCALGSLRARLSLVLFFAAAQTWLAQRAGDAFSQRARPILYIFAGLASAELGLRHALPAAGFAVQRWMCPCETESSSSSRDQPPRPGLEWPNRIALQVGLVVVVLAVDAHIHGTGVRFGQSSAYVALLLLSLLGVIEASRAIFCMDWQSESELSDKPAPTSAFQRTPAEAAEPTEAAKHAQPLASVLRDGVAHQAAGPRGATTLGGRVVPCDLSSLSRFEHDSQGVRAVSRSLSVSSAASSHTPSISSIASASIASSDDLRPSYSCNEEEAVLIRAALDAQLFASTLSARRGTTNIANAGAPLVALQDPALLRGPIFHTIRHAAQASAVVSRDWREARRAQFAWERLKLVLLGQRCRDSPFSQLNDDCIVHILRLLRKLYEAGSN